MQQRTALRTLTATLLLLAGCGDRMPIRGGEAETRAATGQAELAAEGVDLERFGYSLGAEEAPVVVVEFSDFGCPFCARFALETLPLIREEFIETGQVRWQYVPFVMGIFPNGEEATRAAECAADQDRFFEMKNLLYERQREWRGASAAEPVFTSYAGLLELDGDDFSRCYRQNHPAQRIATSNAVAREMGIQSTPNFLVNGRLVQGALPHDQFRMLLQWAGAPGVVE